MQKSEQRPIIQIIVGEDFAHLVGLCEEWPKNVEVDSFCNVSFYIVKKIAKSTNGSIMTILWFTFFSHNVW